MTTPLPDPPDAPDVPTAPATLSPADAAALVAELEAENARLRGDAAHVAG